jgi:hypothetical protein
MNRTRRTIVVLRGAAGLMAVGAVTTTTAWAFPTSVPLVGPTGLGVMPTSDTVPTRQVEAGLFYERAKPDDGWVSFFPDVSATYGFRRGEVGAAYLRENNKQSGFDDTFNYFTLHGKYRFYDNAQTGASVAVGAHYLDFGSDGGFDLGSVISLYVTGAYPLTRRADGRNLRGHLGLIGQRVDDGIDTSTRLRPMFGLEYGVNERVSVATDYLSHSGRIEKTATLMARYQSGTFGVEAGVGKLGSDTKYFAGVTYRFGTAKEAGR